MGIEFEKKNLLQIYFKMSLEEVIDYYQKLRKYQLENEDKIKGIKIRKALYQIIKLILYIDELSKNRSIEVIGDERKKVFLYNENDFSKEKWNKKTRIYSCTHIGRYDIESALRGVNDSCYFVMADPGETYQNIDGLLLRLNGVTWFDMDNKFDCHTANVRQIKALNSGANELVFPEAAYNLEPVQIVGDLHPGMVRRAIKTNSNIIPVSMEQYEDEDTRKKNYVLNIGNSINLENKGLDSDIEIANYIREEMIKLKKEIWEIYGGAKPSMEEFINDPLALSNYKKQIDFIMRDVPSYYTISDIVREVYHPSDEMIKSLKKINYLK